MCQNVNIFCLWGVGSISSSEAMCRTSRASGSARRPTRFPAPVILPNREGSGAPNVLNISLLESLFSFCCCLAAKRQEAIQIYYLPFQEVWRNFSIAVHTNIPPNGHLVIPAHQVTSEECSARLKRHSSFSSLVSDPREKRSFPGLVVTETGSAA